MVRKRAPAQKALSPEKAANAKRRRNSLTEPSTKDNNIDVMNDENDKKKTNFNSIEEIKQENSKKQLNLMVLYY